MKMAIVALVALAAATAAQNQPNQEVISRLLTKGDSVFHIELPPIERPSESIISEQLSALKILQQSS